MKRFYFKARQDTIAVQNAPDIPKDFFNNKKQTEIDEIEQQYNEQQANAFANVDDEQMLITLKGGEF